MVALPGTIICGILTVLFGLASAVWTPVVVPKIVVMPADFSTTVTVSGTFEAQALPGTLARLPTPQTLPLNATVEVKSVSSDDDTVVVSQTETQKVGPPTGPTQDVVLNSQFVLDRRTTQNVNDPRAWSISSDHPVDRAGSYSFALGFDFDPNGTYSWWDDSIRASYQLKQGGNAAQAPAGGLSVTGLTGGATAVPADPTWIAALKPLQLPSSLTVEQWKAAGFPEVSSTSATVNANYFVSITTSMSVDNLTGGTANLVQETLAILVAPDPASTGGKAAAPKTVGTNAFGETPQSVTTDTQSLADDAGQLNLAEKTIPRVLIGLTALFGILTVVFFVLHRRKTAGGTKS